jgi:hypothetical protein
MADKFVTYSGGMDSPATGGFAVTKSDATVFSQPTRFLWVGGVGDVAVRMLDGTTPIFSAVPTGTLLRIRVDKVLSTGTTATLIVGLY